MPARTVGWSLLRAALACLALVTCAWFALSVHQAHALGAATSIISQSTPLTQAQARRAASLLDSAGTLNPDRQVEVLRGQLALARGDAPAAQRILVGVVRAEPQNLNAWIVLVRASKGSPALFKLALARIDQLLPPVRSHR